MNTTYWGPVTEGSGSVIETDHLSILATTGNDAFVYYKTMIDRSKANQVYRIKAVVNNLSSYPSGVNPFIVAEYAGVPVVDAVVTNRIINTYWFWDGVDNRLYIAYYDDLGVARAWTGSAWGSGTSFFTIYDPTTIYWYSIETSADGTQWRYILKDSSDNALETTDWVNWANTRNSVGKDDYIIFGTKWDNRAIDLSVYRAEMGISEDGVNILNYERGIGRGIMRGIGRGIG